MATYVQANRPLTVKTPLDADALLLVGFTGQEEISRLFHFRLELWAANKTDIAFDKLLGQPITVTLVSAVGAKKRYFNGICCRISQGERDQEFTAYRMELAPKLWLLTKKAQSRIFQQKSVPDILKQVLKGLDVAFQIQGQFQPRDYCVQYRETDFNFASRLMEEEGIYYYFTHSEKGHQMVVGNTPGGHPDVSDQSTVTYKHIQAGKPGFYVYDWEKTQEVRSGKYTLWDYSFAKADSHFSADKAIMPEVQVGKVAHKLNVANAELEVYDYPGEYAQRFDGIQPGGGDRAGDVGKIYPDGQRTVDLRMEEEAVPALLLQGASNCQQFSAGHKFSLTTLDKTLENQSKADGAYVLTSALHVVRMTGGIRAGGEVFHYHNTFTCIPAKVSFRPSRLTPRPVIHGTQTAVVVGPPGEEIFTDKYGRVKLQFHWDRDGKKDADSSCWVRVGTFWAGKRWGAIHIPRVGQEVLVAYEEGDPDQPIIVGGLYNATQMPPYQLPDNKTQSGIKSRSTLKGDAANFNELRLEDKKGSEDIYFHAEKDFHRVVENDDDLKVGNDQTIEIKKNRTEKVKEGDEKVTVEKGNRTVVIGMGNDTLTIKMGNQTTKINLGKSETEAMQSIELKVGQSSVKLDQTGVTIKGLLVTVEGTVQTQVKAPMTQVTADAILQLKGGLTMIG